MESANWNKSMVTLATLLFISTYGFSQEGTTRVDKRQTLQSARIVDGRMDGEVTRREAHALRTQQKQIRRSERRAESDGVVTRREKRKLERKQDRASRNIRRAKHNKIDNN